MFIETSAKDGFNIKLLFRRLATALPTLESNGKTSGAAEPDPQVVQLTMAPPQASASSGTAAGGESSSYAAYCGC